MDKHHIETTEQAARDLARIKDRAQRRRIEDAMERLADVPPPGNLDIKPIAGHPPFHRLRVGDWRVVYRQFTPREIQLLVCRLGTLSGPTGFVIERVVDRQYLERNIKTIEITEIV